MKMRIFILLAIALCACATEVPEKEAIAETHNNEKRQTQEGTYSPVQYRTARKQEQVAPVEESQDDDKGLRNRTSPLQQVSEDQGVTVERSTREEPQNQASSTEQTTTVSTNELMKSDQESQKKVNVIVVNDLEQPQSTQETSVEHRGVSLEDRRHSHIPPPQDGKSYTPEEFTSLIVAGFPVTPIPDYNDFGLPNPGIISPATTVASPSQFSSTPILYNQNVHVPSTLPSPVLPLQEQNLRIDQARLLGHYRQSLETLPPPKNHRFYTPEEYNELLAAGYPITAVPVNALSYGVPQPSRSEAEEYRPGQVFSLNAQELLELQPERKAPNTNGQLLQQLYVNPQQEHKQNLQQNLQQSLQQIYYLEPQQQTGRQVPPSHTVIARPQYNFNGGEASVGAALSVSDTGASSADSFDQELLALLGQAQVRPESHAQAYSSAPQHTQSTTVRSVAPQYQQVDRYIAKPTKKASKLRSKVHVSFPQPTEPPQQYLIETTNVQQQQQQQSQPQPQLQYRPTPQPQRLAQALRYVPIAQQAQAQPEFAYERPEAQGLIIVPAPKLQQLRPQQNYRVVSPQYQQQEASPKQYRIIELQQQLRPQAIRQELRLPSSNIERPVAYLKRYPELEKQRSVKIYDPVAENGQQQAQLYGEQFVLRPIYRTNEQQRPRYEVSAKSERVAEQTKPPHSSIYVSKNLPAPRKQRPQSAYREQAEIDQINLEQHGRNLDDQRSHLPPPKNNKAYTPEEFAALVAAGYSVTPVPVSAANLEAAQSRISEESVTPQPKRRLTQRRRNQYLPVRDDAP